MTQEQLKAVLADAVNEKDLRCADIPSIDLYLDQIVSIISDKNREGSEKFADRVLTKAMVNNYSKAGLITPIKGKTYNREQIIQMLLTNSLKNSLSIAEIKAIMDRLYEDEDMSAEKLSEYYEKYLDIKEKNREFCARTAEQLVEENEFDTESMRDTMLAVFGLLSLSDYFSCISRALLEQIIVSAPDGDKDKEKDKKKKNDKKAQKEKSEAQDDESEPSVVFAEPEQES